MKINEESLLALKEKFQSSSASVIITDLKGRIEYVNTQFEKRTGYSSEEVLGKNPRILKSDKTNPNKYKNLWETITSGHTWSGEFENKKKNGDLFWEYSTIYPILNEDKKVTHFLAIREDITAIKKVDKEIEREKLKRKLSIVLKYNFLNRLSHEIRTPVNIMVSFADMFKEHINSDKNPKLTPYMQILKDLNKGIIDTIDFLLYLSENKPDKNKSKLKILSPDFLEELVNSIKIPTQTILGIAISLMSKFANKGEEDLNSLFKIMIASCHRVITTVNIIIESSEKTKDEIEFIHVVNDRIDSVKESYKGEANQKIFQLPSTNLPERIADRFTFGKKVDRLLYNFDNKAKENEWIDEILSSNNVEVDTKKQTKSSKPNTKAIEKNRSIFKLDRNKLIELRKTDDIYVVFVKHIHVDYSATLSFEKFLQKNLVGIKNKIVFDFSLCQKIDTCFWGLLIKLIKQHKFEPSDIYLVLNYSEQTNTFISSHIDEIFSVFNNLQEAINLAKSESKISKRGA